MALKRGFPCQQLIENHAQAPDIGRGGDLARPAFDLLWGHIAGRPHDRAAGGQRGFAVHLARQAEIRHLERAVRGEENVRGLQVPVQHAALVGIGDRLRQGLKVTPPLALLRVASPGAASPGPARRRTSIEK